jgi:hypothetical protein
VYQRIALPGSYLREKKCESPLVGTPKHGPAIATDKSNRIAQMTQSKRHSTDRMVDSRGKYKARACYEAAEKCRWHFHSCSLLIPHALLDNRKERFYAKLQERS